MAGKIGPLKVVSHVVQYRHDGKQDTSQCILYHMTDHLQQACTSKLSISGELSEPQGAEDFFPRFSLSHLLSRAALA